MDDDRPVVELALGAVSIVWLETDPGPCACGREIGIGPVGFHLDPQVPVCDSCLLDLHKDIGTMMWMIHIARELAGRAAGEQNPRMVALMAFAKLFNAGAKWPRREAAAMDFLEELKAGVSPIPGDALVKSLMGIH